MRCRAISESQDSSLQISWGVSFLAIFPADCCEDIKENTNKMGNEASLPMEMATNFDAEEIKRLGKRFKKLDLDNSGSLSVDEFMSLPELQQVIYLIRIPSDNIQ